MTIPFFDLLTMHWMQRICKLRNVILHKSHWRLPRKLVKWQDYDPNHHIWVQFIADRHLVNVQSLLTCRNHVPPYTLLIIGSINNYEITWHWIMFSCCYNSDYYKISFNILIFNLNVLPIKFDILGKITVLTKYSLKWINCCNTY